MHQQSISELNAQLATGTLTSEGLTRHFLERIERAEPRLNCFVTVCGESALTSAREADARLKRGQRAPLLGIPIAHKDIFCTEGIRTTCGSRMLENFVSPYDATVVERLQAAGAVMVGKTNMDEFAMGSSTESSYFGPTANPWDTGRVPGGSSGGSAAAVAARLVPIATATDTGGSIRQPAALTGTVGIKPTYGRVSRYGMIAFASSLDQGGVIARTAEDAAYVLELMCGFDRRDSTSLDRPVPKFTETLDAGIEGLRIGLPREYFDAALDGEIRRCIEDAIKTFEAMGATLHEVSLPGSALGIAAYYVIAPAECSSNLSRFDGVRFGHRTEAPEDLESLYKRSRSEGFGREVMRRIMTGTYTLSAGYFDAYYLKAQKLRRIIRDEFLRTFEDVDVLMGPTTPTAAFALGEKTDPVSMYLCDTYTTTVNLAGLPGISVPAGFVDGLPVGLQIIGPHFEEARLLNLAHRYQQRTDWHRQHPGEVEVLT